MNRFIDKRGWLYLILVTLTAIALAFLFFLYGRQGFYWDAAVYVRLGERIATQGLFQFQDDTRTFGYPLFIAVIYLLSTFLVLPLQLLVFIFQLFVFLSICFFAVRIFRDLFQNTGLAFILFALLALNPFLLIYTGVILSDLLSAGFDFLAILFAVRASSSNPSFSRTAVSGQVARSHAIDLLLSFLAAGCATMIRPANLPIGLAVLSLWLLRFLFYKEGRLAWLGLAALGFCIPFIPQLVNNYRAFGVVQPLIVRGLYEEQLAWGTHYLKFVSLVIPGGSSGIIYQNPFITSAITSPLDLLLKEPLNFLMTLGIHLFALFDHDYAFPYVVNVDVGYRLPLSILNYGFLFSSLVGLFTWMQRALRLRFCDRLDWALAGMLLGAVFYVMEYLSTAIEPRFSLPVYLFFSPFVVYAFSQTRTVLAQRHWKTIAIGSLAFVGFLIMNLTIYHWLQSQVPFLDATMHSPIALERYTMYDLRARFGDQIEARRYGLDQSYQPQGGNTLYVAIEWQCNPVSIDSDQPQIDLVDSNNHVWAQMFHDPQVEYNPCANRLWFPSLATDLVALRLPVTMPDGEYHVILSYYDRRNDNFIAAYSPSNELLGEHVEFGNVFVSKNKDSFTANELFIKNPFFVDMNEMRFLGYADLPERVQPGTQLDVGLYWRARGKPQGDYMVTVQLRDLLGNIIVKQTARPAEDTYPTTQWNEGEVLLDWHALALPTTIPDGDYQLVTLLSDAADNRLLGQAEFAKIHLAQ